MEYVNKILINVLTNDKYFIVVESTNNLYYTYNLTHDKSQFIPIDSNMKSVSLKDLNTSEQAVFNKYISTISKEALLKIKLTTLHSIEI